MQRAETTLQGDLLADEAERALADGHFAEAVRLFDGAEPHVVDRDRCAGGRWMAHMMRGDFEAAWRESDSVRKRGRPDPHRFWNGEAFAGKRVMLRSLHGFGDAVQMLRFLPRLTAQASGVVLEVAPRLVSLARCFAGTQEVITWGEGAPVRQPAWDVQLEVTELPYALRVNTGELEPKQGYLCLPEEERARACEVVSTSARPRVGLVWSAGEWNPTRSVPFAMLERKLLVAGDVSFWSLQGEPERSAWQGRGEHARCFDSFLCGDGLVPMAAVVEQMDLVITVDTLAAHLAGALGVPCWLLLQHHADWRWMAAREDTPWYPSLRLWRRRAEGDWSELLGRVGDALRRWARERKGAER